MPGRPRHHKPLDKRFSAALSDQAYARLRELAEATALSNNYVLTVLLEGIDEVVDRDAFMAAARAMVDRHCPPEPR